MNRGLGERIFDVAVVISMVTMMAAMLYPFMYTISLSVSRPTAVMAGKVWLFPVGFTTSAYEHVLTQSGLMRSFLTSAFYVVAGTGTMIILCSLISYPLSLKVFRPRGFVMILVLITMLFDGGMIPTYLWIRALGMLDTVWAIIIPSAMNAWYVILFRTFLQQHPESLRESALIDGATDVRILLQIILPLSMPILATLSIFHMVYHWNSFFPALLYLRSEHLMPAQMLLRRVLAEATNIEDMLREGSETLTLPLSVQAAFVVVIVFPVVAVYPFAQKYFTRGVMLGAIKG